MAVAEQQPQYEHVALIHRGPDDLARRLAPNLHRAAAEGAAVLLCLDSVAEARVRVGVGSICNSFEFQTADSRYATPGTAMAALHAFAMAAFSAGAPTAWAIGAIPLGRDGLAGRWIRYEEAVEAIFAEHPLRAVCLYDADSTPTDLRAGIQRTHQSLDGEWIDGAHDHLEAEPAQIHPARAPDLVLQDPTPRRARESVVAIFGGLLSAVATDDLKLVCSELATNAVIHGAPPAQLRVWCEPTGCVVQLSDAGAAIIDRFADLRPCLGGSHGGFGLWTIGQLAHSMDISRQCDANVVTVSLPHQ